MGGRPSAPSGSGERAGWRGPALVVGAGLLLAVVFTWPLPAHLVDGLPYASVPPPGREVVWRAQGDYLQFFYYLWLVKDRLAHGASPLRDPYQFAVGPPRWNLPNLFLPFALLYVPLSVAGDRLAYNLLVLLSFPAATLATWLLARRLGLGAGPALLAGVILALAPYRLGALLGGHPAGLAYFLVPLAVWGLEGALAGSRAGGVWAGVAILSLAIVEPHYFYFAGLGLPLYAAARLALPAWRVELLHPGPLAWLGTGAIAAGPALGVRAALRAQGWEAGAGAEWAVAMVVAGGALAAWQVGAAGLLASGAVADPGRAARWSLLLCLPFVLVAAAGGHGGTGLAVAALLLPLLAHVATCGAALLRDPARRARLPAGPLAAVVAGAALGSGFMLLLRQMLLNRSVSGGGRTLHEVLLFSPLPADLLVRANPIASRAVYPGMVAVALAVVAAVAWVRQPPAPERRALLIFLALFPLAGVLALGPRLTSLPLFEVAFRLVPTWNFIRQPAKVQVLAGLALAVVAGAGAQALGAALRRPALRTALFAGLAVLVALDYHPGQRAGVSLLPAPGSAHAAIRAEGPRALYLPLWPGDSSYSSLYLLTTTMTRVPLLNGYSAWVDRSYVTDVYRALELANLGHVGPAEHAALRRLEVHQVVLDTEAFPLKVSPFGAAYTLAGLRRSPYLEEVRPAGDDGLWIFRVRAEAGPAGPPPPPSPLGIYWEAESLARDTGQAVADPGAWGGRLVSAEAPRDLRGFLTHGPYRYLLPGRYRASFRLRGEGAEVTVQVIARTRLLAERTVTLESFRFQEVPLTFEVEAPALLQYRTGWNGRGRAQVDAVAVAFADVADPPAVLEVEALGHDLVERDDPAASGGRAGLAVPGRTPRDVVWLGPLRRYPAGRYRLLVRLRAEPAGGKPSGPLAWCGVRGASGGPDLAGRDLLPAELPSDGLYAELAVPFELTQPMVLELPCRYRGTAAVWFDRLAVEGPLGP